MLPDRGVLGPGVPVLTRPPTDGGRASGVPVRGVVLGDGDPGVIFVGDMEPWLAYQHPDCVLLVDVIPSSSTVSALQSSGSRVRRLQLELVVSQRVGGQVAPLVGVCLGGRTSRDGEDS